jgi:hypothetical protein
MIPADVQGATQDMTRVVAASARLISRWSASERLTDPETELEHIQANLNHVLELMGK